MLAGCSTQTSPPSPAPVPARTPPPLPSIATVQRAIVQVKPQTVIAPAAGHAVTVMLAWDAPTDTNVAGIELCYGNRRGQGNVLQMGIGATNQTLTLDDRLPWFFALRNYELAGNPVITCISNAQFISCQTNPNVYGEAAVASYASPNLLPYLTIEHSNAVLHFMGASNMVYTVETGEAITNLQAVALVLGTNGAAEWMDTNVVAGAKYFALKRAAMQNTQ